MSIAIAGAGIAGLTLGLTLHELGLPFRIYEAVPKLGPLGVGINLQPHAVRELFELGLEKELSEIGVKTKDYGFYTTSGRKIWEELRGLEAGYHWPQYSVHRGQLQQLLLRTVLERVGEDAVKPGHRLTGYRNRQGCVDIDLTTNNAKRTVTADILIAADGIRSAARAQAHPDEGEPNWNGVVLWRATTRARPFKSAASMILAGHDNQRFVAYPISEPDEKGMATINWIAEKRFDPAQGWQQSDWNRAVDRSIFAPDFAAWDFDWLNIPELIAGAEEVLEYPMVDRDPLARWTDGRVTLIGDAAHPTYPVGSNGASQAILDARILGAQLRDFGVGSAALEAYEDELRPRTTAIQIANRGEGPDAVMQWVHDLSGGVFDSIEDVLPLEKLAAHAERYKQLAGFTVDQVNSCPAILAKP